MGDWENWLSVTNANYTKPHTEADERDQCKRWNHKNIEYIGEYFIFIGIEKNVLCLNTIKEIRKEKINRFSYIKILKVLLSQNIPQTESQREVE